MSNPAELEIVKQEINIDDNAVNCNYQSNKNHFTFDEFYEISQLSEEIVSKNLRKYNSQLSDMIYFTRVVLQFTNEILIDSVKIRDLLEEKTGRKIFILADSAKAGCCVDIVGAKHVNPDFVVHFGDACLSDDIPSTIQIKYIFPKLLVDLKQLSLAINDFEVAGNFKNDIMVVVDTPFYHKNEEIYQAILTELKDRRVIKTIIIEDSQVDNFESENEYFAFKRYIKRQSPSLLAEKKDILIVGLQKSKLNDNIKLLKDRYNIDKVILCDPTNQYQLEVYKDCSKVLMKRYFMIEEAKKADIFGILINKANIERYGDILKRTKQILKQCNKKFYLFIINKLTEQKLGNFPEIDAYIIIACPYFTFYDLKDFYKVLINPFELEFAVAGSSWKNYILSDLNSITQEQFPTVNNEPEENKRDDEKQNHQNQIAYNGSNGQIIALDFLKSLDFHRERTYKGLDKTIGKIFHCSPFLIDLEAEVKMAVKGRSGLAREYDDEPKI